MQYVAVLSSKNLRLMPTTPAHARKLLKQKRAKIYKHKPIFTIQLLDHESGEVQPIEYKCDTGYQHIGISICSEKHEYVSQQRDLLKDEPENHRNRQIHRYERRSRLRYKEPRFNNRISSKRNGWFAPSIQNKLDQHLFLYNSFKDVIPISENVFEIGQFDQKAIDTFREDRSQLNKNLSLKTKNSYIGNVRETVFSRDNYTCQICGRGIEEKAILHTHHIGYWNKDRTNRISNLLTVCEKCHTPKNHAEGGALFGLKPLSVSTKEASFMSNVKRKLKDDVKQESKDISSKVTFGFETKANRRKLHLRKSHVNDAYSMGNLHPKHRSQTTYWQKCRRNNRVLEKFYDAKYRDSRDNSIKKGKELTNGRISRNHKKDFENEHPYRAEKISGGRRVIRFKRYSLRPGDIILYKRKKYKIKGVHHNGTRVILANTNKSVSIQKIICVEHCGGWKLI